MFCLFTEKRSKHIIPITAQFYDEFMSSMRTTFIIFEIRCAVEVFASMVWRTNIRYEFQLPEDEFLQEYI